MKLLLDSHVLVWTLLDDRRLLPRVRRVLANPENQKLHSWISLWELSIKISKGKLNTLGSSVVYLRDEMAELGVAQLPITVDHILTLERLDPHHNDPFDRMLVAQALHENLTLVTADPAFSSYPIQILW